MRCPRFKIPTKKFFSCSDRIPSPRNYPRLDESFCRGLLGVRNAHVCHVIWKSKCTISRRRRETHRSSQHPFEDTLAKPSDTRNSIMHGTIEFAVGCSAQPTAEALIRKASQYLFLSFTASIADLCHLSAWSATLLCG